MIKQYRFDEFDKASKSQWTDKLNQDLGADLARRISSWTSERNLTLSAYYDQEDVGKDINVPVRPVEGWKYIEPLHPERTNAQVLDALMSGADGLMLTDSHVRRLNKVLGQVAPEYCTLALKASGFPIYHQFVEWWIDRHPENGQGEVLLFGDKQRAEQFSIISKAFDIGHALGHRTIHIDGAWVQTQGGSSHLELGYILSQSVYYINSLLDLGYDIQVIARGMFVATSMGSSYFLALTKLRSIRLLISQLFKLYGLSEVYTPIHASTSLFTKSALDSNTNFLRCTSEAMSAVLGGADYISITPAHELKSADRIARNISNLMKEESLLDKVTDPAAGSYYLDYLTDLLSQQAWNTFQQVEKRGGYEVATKEKYFEKEIQKDLEFQQSRLASGRRKMVGVNDFGNQSEKVSLATLDNDRTTISKNFEEVRKQVEASVEGQGEAYRPVVYLLPVGTNAKMITARHTFVSNFFNWAGFIVKPYQDEISTPMMGVVACCGADEDYTKEQIDSALNGIDTACILIAAGNITEGSSSKISTWIHAKTDRLEGVINILNQMGITSNSLQS
ncbi:methylmalonyl-CoA mutase family protein [Reichenbachiella carrageenanivorans]|uniref:Methylmalonyl-CoA mutase family protein n=1 Tax=Reichenbachiella carrageenanivorans TaxID=2979869 RepID=A0ABY6CVW0_9BACT|nr:methylmalonyl-CoA mutase family protein [Reichenbachiella carrageenanivorans]UXX78042.1 methylmalonyl-CoA mutase family protein [Reichenbachiella carrageenanivorans]